MRKRVLGQGQPNQSKTTPPTSNQELRQSRNMPWSSNTTKAASPLPRDGQDRQWCSFGSVTQLGSQLFDIPMSIRTDMVI